jgi:excisionase family DNA binding protein
MPEVAIDPQTLIALTEKVAELSASLQDVLASLHATYPDSYVSTDEAAEILGTTAQNVRYLARRGSLKSIKDGPRLVRISVQSIRAYKG